MNGESISGTESKSEQRSTVTLSEVDGRGAKAYILQTTDIKDGRLISTETMYNMQRALGNGWTVDNQGNQLFIFPREHFDDAYKIVASAAKNVFSNQYDTSLIQ